MDRLQAVQQTMRLLGRDVVQAAPRPVRDPLNGNLRPAFLVNPGGEFAGAPPPAAPPATPGPQGMQIGSGEAGAGE